MPSTSFLVNKFEESVLEAQALASLAESSTEFTHINRLYVFEAAYLLIFSAWEAFLEESMIRFIAGYSNANGKMSPVVGKQFEPSLVSAKQQLYGAKSYLLWHSPQHAISRSQAWFSAGVIETVLSSAYTDLMHFAAIRHYIAHRSPDCRLKFDNATLGLDGVTVPKSRAGRFLRKSTVNPVTGVSIQWIVKISDDLISYAKQVAF